MLYRQEKKRRRVYGTHVQRLPTVTRPHCYCTSTSCRPLTHCRSVKEYRGLHPNLADWRIGLDLLAESVTVKAPAATAMAPMARVLAPVVASRTYRPEMSPVKYNNRFLILRSLATVAVIISAGDSIYIH
jgi:hypothetical protein